VLQTGGDVIFSLTWRPDMWYGSHKSWKSWKVIYSFPGPGNVLEFKTIMKSGKIIACEKIHLEQKSL